jgi:polyhydroxyalkanoate synthase
MSDEGLAPTVAALQHGPRPLPLFLSMLRSETAASPERRTAALAGLRVYQQVPRSPRPAPMPAIAVAGRASLRDYGGAGATVVFVPSLINPPFVLDLAPDTSLLRWLAAQGLRVLLVDWGSPSPSDRTQDVTSHVEDMLLPMLRTLPTSPMLVGYCLGGTIAVAAAQLLPAAGLALLATPWRFAGFEDASRAAIAQLWADAQPACDRLGLVPMEVLQSGFWQLDPARTVAKFEGLADVDPTSDAARAFVVLEDWANAGAPLAHAAGRQVFERFFAADDPGQGRWVVAGAAIDPHALTCPVADFVSTRDRIVPVESSAAVPARRLVDAGHVGMIVGSRARALVWEPLAHWLSSMAAAR